MLFLTGNWTRDLHVASCHANHWAMMTWFSFKSITLKILRYRRYLPYTSNFVYSNIATSAYKAYSMWDELVDSVMLSNVPITLVGILEATQEKEINIEFFYERLFLYPFKRK